MRRAFALAALGLAALAGPATAGAAQPATTRTAPDWATHVERTPEGGHRMGNPNAARKLVEYGSIGCSHCADFESEAGAAIREQVRTGRLSFEYRPFLIFPSDPGIFLLLNCQAPAKFFDTVHTLYSTQDDWVAKLETQDAQIRAEIQRSSYVAALPSIVRATGTDQVFRQNGLSDQQIATCLSDQTAMQRLADGTRQGQTLGVDGTPTFFLDGRKLELANFGELVAMLRQP